MKILFLHGLEGSPSGEKATHLCHNYDTVVPTLDVSGFKVLYERHGEVLDDIFYLEGVQESLEKPLKQARDVILIDKPDLVIGSSFGGALLAMLIVEGTWDGPSLFLASAAKKLTGLNRVTQTPGNGLHWIHGAQDEIIPCEDSITAALASQGTLEIVQDDHRLSGIIKSGKLDDAIARLTGKREKT